MMRIDPGGIGFTSVFSQDHNESTSAPQVVSIIDDNTYARD